MMTTVMIVLGDKWPFLPLPMYNHRLLTNCNRDIKWSQNLLIITSDCQDQSGRLSEECLRLWQKDAWQREGQKAKEKQKFFSSTEPRKCSQHFKSHMIAFTSSALALALAPVLMAPWPLTGMTPPVGRLIVLFCRPPLYLARRHPATNS